MFTINTALLSGFNLLVGAIITWLFSRRKQRADLAKSKEETAQTYLNNVETAVTLWKNVASDLETQLDKLNNRCVELTLEIEQLRKENKELKHAYDDLILTINSKVKEMTL